LTDWDEAGVANIVLTPVVAIEVEQALNRTANKGKWTARTKTLRNLSVNMAGTPPWN
jgi:hypothetical protein